MTTHKHDFAPSRAFRPAILALAAVWALGGCTDSTAPLDVGAPGVDSAIREMDAGPMDSGAVDATRRDSTSADAGEEDAPSFDANEYADAGASDAATDVPEDVASVRYERDLRPLLEASACAACHTSMGDLVMDYAWISAPGETWCDGARYERRWDCVEQHARTQVVEADGSCDTDFYHRHGEPCFTEETRLRVLAWAADGYRE